MGRNHGGLQAYVCVRCGDAWSEYHAAHVPVPTALTALCLPCTWASLDGGPDSPQRHGERLCAASGAHHADARTGAIGGGA